MTADRLGEPGGYTLSGYVEIAKHDAWKKRAHDAELACGYLEERVERLTAALRRLVNAAEPKGARQAKGAATRMTELTEQWSAIDAARALLASGEGSEQSPNTRSGKMGDTK